MRMRQRLRGVGALPDGADALGDVLGEIADALEVGRHADRADHGAQVLRHGLALGDQRDRACRRARAAWRP
jgi:hypothetical protein